MGQKVHPIGYRLGITKTWQSRWLNKKEMPKFIIEDEKLRKFIRSRVGAAGISRLDIERMGETIRITIYTDKPGVVIGRGGSEVENIKNEIDDMTGKRTVINIEHIKKPHIDANLVAGTIATALIKKIKFRSILKRSIARAREEGVEGIKIAVSGRLNGAEIARTEWMKEGKIPLQTLRANIDYGFAEAKTTYGNIGVKVWICHKSDVVVTGEIGNETEEG